SKLEQIIINLVGNAIKFTQSGSICVKANINEQMTQADPAGRHWLQISVSDTGIGIPNDKQEMIFEKFNQVDGSSHREFEGSGLGLSIVKKYIEFFGGNISVESEVNKGAAFTFTFPYTPQKTIVESNLQPNIIIPLKERASKIITPLSILIVDDDKTSRKVLEMSLSNILIKDGQQITLANNGFEAINLVKEKNIYNLIFMDIQMRGIDGFKTTIEILKLIGSNVIVVPITAGVKEGIEEKCIQSGMRDFISKPYELEQIYQIIEKYFSIIE
ncbi:ATP-binding protein, partial [Candidatus Margulisiibacteriota bacterium]